jgi:hypothetical protein
MQQKIRVAFVYKESADAVSPNYFATTYYHFFMDALKRNNRIDVTYFPSNDKFDTSILKEKFDIILLCDNYPAGSPDELIGIKNLNIPVVCRVNDPHDAQVKGKIAYHEKYKIDYYFGYIQEPFFHKYYPKEFKYKVIIYGIEPSLYQNLTPFSKRIKNKILCSGAAENSKFYNRIIEIIIRWRGELSLHKHYKLRSMCTRLPYVDYTTTLEHQYIGDKYPELLSKYAGSIAAHSLYPVIKYLEIPASGCLTFMEVTKKNNADIFGFKDGETAIFINEKNYKDKFQEFLDDPENPKWEKIANAGRRYTLEQLNNDKAVESLVDLMEKLI